MTVFRCSLENFESKSDQELRDRWNETEDANDYTVKELERLLEMAEDAESELEKEIGWNHGFISEDKPKLEALIAIKTLGYPVAQVSLAPQLSDKAAWSKYLEYCETKLFNAIGGSDEFTYYENEIAKCVEALEQL